MYKLGGRQWGLSPHCHSAVARAKSLLGTVRAVVAPVPSLCPPGLGGSGGTGMGTGMLGVWEHPVCRSGLGDTESTGTPSTGDTERTGMRTGMCKGTLSLGTLSTEGH